MKVFSLNSTPVPNAVFDLIMPRVSPAAWKILSVLIRATYGWVDPASETGRKRKDVLSYSQFQSRGGPGLQSKSTVSAAIRELLELNFIVRNQVGSSPFGTAIYEYWLNYDLELEADPPAPSTDVQILDGSMSKKQTSIGPNNGHSAGPDNGHSAGPDNGHTKEKKSTNKEISVVASILSEFGIRPPALVTMASGWSEEHARRAVAYAIKANLGPGWLVNSFKRGDPVPDPVDYGPFIEPEFNPTPLTAGEAAWSDILNVASLEGFDELICQLDPDPELDNNELVLRGPSSVIDRIRYHLLNRLVAAATDVSGGSLGIRLQGGDDTPISYK